MIPMSRYCFFLLLVASSVFALNPQEDLPDFAISEVRASIGRLGRGSVVFVLKLKPGAEVGALVRTLKDDFRESWETKVFSENDRVCVRQSFNSIIGLFVLLGLFNRTPGNDIACEVRYSGSELSVLLDGPQIDDGADDGALQKCWLYLDFDGAIKKTNGFVVSKEDGRVKWRMDRVVRSGLSVVITQAGTEKKNSSGK